MADLKPQIAQDFLQLKLAAKTLRQTSTDKKNKFLKTLGAALKNNEAAILSANKLDLEALSPDTTPAFRDRLTLNAARIDGMIASLNKVAELADPVGAVVENQTLANGLKLKKVRAPLGVIFMIFESRPNVITEAFALAFKSGNGIALRGGSDSRHSAAVIYGIMKDTLKGEGFSENTFLGITDYDRSIVEALLARKDLVDVAVPRGGEKLIAFVQEKALMPIIKNDRGMCHAYIDEDADIRMAVEIVKNGKTQRPGVCNALETVLVNSKIASQFLLALYEATNSVALSWRADEESVRILSGKPRVQPAAPSDWDTEHLDLILNCKIVDTIESAMLHIEKHGSKHSEVIVTKSESKARRFQNEIDAAAVYWNASSRFTDGYEFGLGGELGISTQKLHVRGPVGLNELTTPRWVIDGTGQVR